VEELSWECGKQLARPLYIDQLKKVIAVVPPVGALTSTCPEVVQALSEGRLESWSISQCPRL